MSESEFEKTLHDDMIEKLENVRNIENGGLGYAIRYPIRAFCTSEWLRGNMSLLLTKRGKHHYEIEFSPRYSYDDLSEEEKNLTLKIGLEAIVSVFLGTVSV